MNDQDQIDTARQAQRDLCDRLDYPHFAPKSGLCYRCHSNIYAGDRARDGTEHVTGCPYCYYSYCS